MVERLLLQQNTISSQNKTYMTLTRIKRRTDRQQWRVVLAALLLAVGFVTASAQDRTVTGKVTDAADGEPLIGATVTVNRNHGLP